MNNLPINTHVTANKPICPCKGGGTQQIQGTIQKIITNSTGTWYYLDNGNTISSQWIIQHN